MLPYTSAIKSPGLPAHLQVQPCCVNHKRTLAHYLERRFLQAVYTYLVQILRQSHGGTDLSLRAQFAAI